MMQKPGCGPNSTLKQGGLPSPGPFATVVVSKVAVVWIFAGVVTVLVEAGVFVGAVLVEAGAVGVVVGTSLREVHCTHSPTVAVKSGAFVTGAGNRVACRSALDAQPSCCFASAHLLVRSLSPL